MDASHRRETLIRGACSLRRFGARPSVARTLAAIVSVALTGVTLSDVARADELLRGTARHLAAGGAQMGVSEDVGVVGSNPATIAGLRESAVVIGLVSGFGSESLAGEVSDFEPIGLLPRASFALPLSERVSFGLHVAPWDRRNATYSTTKLSRFGYDGGVSLGYLLPADWLPGTARLGATYRLRLDSEDRTTAEAVSGGFALAPLGGTLGLQYSPIDELNFGLAVESGAALTRTMDGTFRGTTAEVTSRGWSPWSLRTGFAFELDRFGFRADYALGLSNVDAEVRLTAPGETPIRYGQGRVPTHGVLTGFEYRLPLGNDALPLRVGYALSSGRDVEEYASAFQGQFSPQSSFTAGVGYRARRFEVSFAAAYRMSQVTLAGAPRAADCDACLGGGRYGSESLLVAVDFEYRFSR